MNISFLTSGHNPFDDRIFYHMGRSLYAHSHNIEIVSSKLNLLEVADGIKLNCFAGDKLSKKNKIRQFAERITRFQPQVIICSEPLTLLAAKQYSKKQSAKIRIVYDITEWYPSKKHLSLYKPFLRSLIFFKLLIFNFLASRYADALIFGEWYKSIPYRFIFPNKPFVFITYYPDLDYIRYNEPSMTRGKLSLAYSGKMSIEKGFKNFIIVLEELTRCKTNLKIEVNIIGWYETIRDKKDCENIIGSLSPDITLRIFERQRFKDFIEHIRETDIFLDLRSADFENQHCLPIKLFYYAASGRPVIFSDLKAIRKEVEIDKFGFLVNPSDKKRIVRLIVEYLENRDLYYKHCANARYLAESEYNWKKIEPQFLKFITSY